MALNTAQAETDVLALLDDMAARTTDPGQSRRDYARELVRIMADMMRTGTVTGTVTTTGSATTQTGTITTATIS
ncbi:hypothetical protein Q5H93_21775 [Hymenobacter sp. ASUV-10]|uniref:Uncharacterized protein n=1 Tax=Hymenobacter aranciens TaxID=3063996 RepID=A0ABT9BGI7_9BACT|nr:hypothetical protein [Hymenobacter sp. ASUV-10]MDO7877386.1 hypothetical protein [Hymenobacter sp. ASUV-10]